MIRYGFELEGFALDNEGNVVVPPVDWPCDGFPGLVEIRTSGGKSIGEQFGYLLEKICDLKEIKGLSFDFTDTYECTFSGEQMAFMRKHRHFVKTAFDISNLYGKAPRRLGNKTIASFQINISNEIAQKQKIATLSDKQTAYLEERPARYGLLDVGRIVKELDREFAKEIKASNRQPGMYAIKDNGIRLEYRSLPNFVINEPLLIKRIKLAVEGPKEE